MTFSTNSGDLRQAAQEARSEQNRANAAPQPPVSSGINFDSDEPLTGGVCDMSAGCESCQ